MELNKDKIFRYEFAILALSAFAFSYVPIINLPFTWIMTFFHEISHGIAALFTGGSVSKIELDLRGSGRCYTRGGFRFIVVNAGYIGAVIWGFIIYEMADVINHKYTDILAKFFAGLVFFTAILYARDIVTWLILIVLFGMFVSIIKLNKALYMKLCLKFVGMYVLLDAVRAPLHLLDGKDLGDGAALAEMTFLPEIFWVIIWLIIGCLGLYFLWKSNRNID